MNAPGGTEEIEFKSVNGYIPALAILLIVFGLPTLIVNEVRSGEPNEALVAISVVVGVLLAAFLAKGLYMLQPNQSALLMPEWLVREAAGRYELTRWDDLYALKDEAQVSISNLVVRLQRLRMIYIPEGTKAIYRSEDEFRGQRRLF